MLEGDVCNQKGKGSLPSYLGANGLESHLDYTLVTNVAIIRSSYALGKRND